MKRAIKNHLRDFIALTVLFLIALGVSGYILSNQRLNLPSWVPGVGKDFYEVNAEFSTAQAVVPGQGQTVDIAGIEVGQIGDVRLENGVAVVKLKINNKYGPIYKDAHMLLRPKTGLKDMVVEMDPGTKKKGNELPEGGTIPVEQTAPDVNLDEILSSLDTDTRTYLQVLVGEAGQAFGKKGYSADLRETFKRFEPTNRDVAKITGLLSKRRENMKRLVHNFGTLTGELAGRDDQISQFVDSANANFRALASQDANIRESLRLLPGTLETAKTTLGKAKTLADNLGPTFQDLRPAARALGPALIEVRPFLTDTRPVIEHQLRPFSKKVRPTVRSLRVAAQRLRPLTPRLTRTFTVVNSLLNTLAYNPPGDEEGYLFWTAWANHAAATVFGTQDAHGPIRRGLIVTSCDSLQLLETITAQNPALDTLFKLLNAPVFEEICPQPVPGPGSPGSPKGGAKPKQRDSKPGAGVPDGNPTTGKPVDPQAAPPAAAAPQSGSVPAAPGKGGEG